MNKYVYQELLDFYAEEALYNGMGIYQSSNFALLQSNFYNYNTSYQTNYKLNPIGVRRGHSPNSQVNCLASGDFDANGITDFVGVDNSNGIFNLYTPSSCNPNDANNCWFMASSTSHTGTWNGIAVADFNTNHSGQEFVALNKSTGKLHYFEFTNSNLSEQSISTTQLNWAGIAAFGNNKALAISINGDYYLVTYSSTIQLTYLGNISAQISEFCSGKFDTTNSLPQFAIADNQTGNITIYQLVNNQLQQTYQYVGLAGVNNIWNALTAGDMDGDGASELIAHKNFDGELIFYKIKNNALVPVYGEFFPVDQQIAAITTGKVSIDDSKDALIIQRNFDGQIILFNMDGNCPSLNLNNLNVDDNFSINNVFTNVNNNYPIDFHSNNVLTASNFTIANDGSQVAFLAGNQVHLKAGFNAKAGSIFHAVIEPGLSCSQTALRMAAPIAKPQNSNAIATIPFINKLPTSFSIQPNPFSQTAQLTYQLESTTTVTISIYNVYGQLVQTLLNNELKEKGIITATIDRANLTNGIYFVQLKTDNYINRMKVVLQ